MEKDPYRYFRVEARELTDGLGKAILQLERDGADAAQVAQILRLAHTLKGAARVVRQRGIADIAHAMEDALAPYRDAGAGAVPRACAETLLAMLDGISAQVGALDPAPPEAAGTPPPDEGTQAVFRPDMAELDRLARRAGEAQASLAELRDGLATLRSMGQRIALLTQVRGPKRSGEASDPGSRIHAIGVDLRGSFTALERALTAAADQLGRDLAQLGAAAQRLQLVPAEALFGALERVARDAARALGRDVDFHGEGGDLRLEARMLATAQGALAQLVRNAVAHGIEPAEERRAAGKPDRGTIRVEVVRRGRRIGFTCADDGRGVDLAAVRRAAEARGLAAAGVEAPDAEALMRLLLRGGISTAGSVTPVSGRGIGMDIVRDAAQRLRGEVNVSTKASKGTAMELLVPMSTASLPALRVEAAGQTVAIPLDAVRRISRVAPEDIAGTAHGQTAVHEGEAVPLASLTAILEGRPTGADRGRARPVIFVEGTQGVAAIAAGRLHGIVQIVMRPLPPGTPPVPLVAGFSLDDRGNPQPVLYPDALVAAARGLHDAPEGPRPVPSVLVVDDSLTTRMLEQSILETAGYSVETACSGEEALKKARKGRFGLMLVDVEMPGMDGFTLIERLRADAALRDIPAILVTSRASADDRERGKAVGAQDYIVKSEFDQAAFLAGVRRMAGAP